MNNKVILLFLIFLGLSNTEIKAQCTKAEAYVAKVKAAENWTPTERVKSGSKVQGWTQLGTWHAYKCECDKGGRTPEQAENLKNGLNEIRKTIVSLYSDAGEIPPVVTKCKSGTNSYTTNNLNNNKSSFQIEMENRFNNYNKAMSLKNQGENIAKAFAEQVKQFGNLNNASTPQELLNNFNQNMSQIAQLQAQNRVDNLNQIDATLGSALNDLNNGNGEGALFSTLSLIDQSYEQKQAKKDAEYQKQKLVLQHKQQMSQFYWKAVDLNNNAINSYYKNAAYAFSSQDEQYYLDFVAHHECFKKHMKNNFSFSNTNWTVNNCIVPEKKVTLENNLTAKEIQYKNTASRKYKLYEETGADEFKQAAIRFAGMAANENPSAENYYHLGHYAGIEEPITAFIAFSTVKELNSKYFDSSKQGEYLLIQNAIESTFKDAIIDNNLEFVKSAIGADLHKIVLIESNSAIVFAIQQDKPDVVQLFLNDLTKGKTQQQITTKVNEVILMASTLDAPKTIQRFVDIGFSVDFKIKDKHPVDVAVESYSVNAFRVLMNLSKEREYYMSKFKARDILKYDAIFNSFKAGNFEDSIKKYNELNEDKLKQVLLKDLYTLHDKSAFFYLLSLNDKALNSTKNLDNEYNYKNDFYLSLINEKDTLSYKYLQLNLIQFKTANLSKAEQNDFFLLAYRHKDSLISANAFQSKVNGSISGALLYFDLINVESEIDYQGEFEKYKTDGFSNLMTTAFSSGKYQTAYLLFKQTGEPIDIDYLKPPNLQTFYSRPYDDENPKTIRYFNEQLDFMDFNEDFPFGMLKTIIFNALETKNEDSYKELKQVMNKLIENKFIPETEILVNNYLGKPKNWSYYKKIRLCKNCPEFRKKDEKYWEAIWTGNFDERNK